MAPLILLSVLFMMIFGLISSYFFPSSMLFPWLLSILPIPSSPKPAERPVTEKKGKGAMAVTGTGDIEFVFSTFDSDGDGFITARELEESFHRLGLPASDKEATKMIESVDANGDGLIDLCEFRQLYNSTVRSTRAKSEEEEEEEEDVDLREAFDVFDDNRDGVITVEELGLVLKSLGQMMEEKDCSDMIKKVDLDGDGRVSFDEFKEMMMAKGSHDLYN